MKKRIVKKKNRGADSSLAQVARAGKRCLFVSGWLLPLFLIFSCQNDPPAVNVSPNAETALFSKLPASETGIDFVNKVEDGKEFNVLTYRNFYNGGGVGIGDINNDGLDDVFFTANMASNRLYLNKGDLKFEDISESSGIAGKRGWSTGVSMVDINADGWMDIYVSNSGNISGDDRENELYINNGDLTFTERAKEYNLANGGFSTHASFFDYDGDGDLDCYILNNSFKDPKQLASFSKTREGDDPLGGDRLMRNDNGVFKDVSKAAGLYTSAIGFGLGVSVSDINQDYLPDIYISNDFWERDYIYINQGDGSFSEELMERVNICSVSSMGADVADLNNDGSMDIFTTDMLAADNYRLKVMTMFDPFYLDNLKYRESFHYQVLQNCLQINDGSGNFTEMANMSEAAATDWSWGALIFDFDNDGWQDIYVCNGIYRDIMDQDFTNFITDKDEIKNVVSKRGEFDFRDFLPYLPSTPIHNYAFINQRNNQFKNKAQALGFDEAEFSNGAAYGDLDNDGDLDLVINNVNMPASVYENTSSGTNYLHVQLQNENGDNRLGIGATVTLKTPDNEYVQQNYTARGFQSSVSPGLIFGLGAVTTVSELHIVWPDRTEQTISQPAINQTLVIKKEPGQKVTPASSKSESAAVQLVNAIKGDSRHKEDDFNDFNHEPLLPRMHSTEGPELITGDINGDGRSDFIALGATGDVDKVFVQNENGQFSRQQTNAFDADRNFESTCGALFDEDNDGDLDLVLGSGGNDFSIGMRGYLLRFYENDGRGNFTRQLGKTPPAGGQFSAIIPADFDADGDMDLFIAARSIPGNYGLTPRSFLLMKDLGKWRDIAPKELATAGMITDAAWADYDGDGSFDLVLAGEWMPITVFLNKRGDFSQSIRIPNSEGWWLDIAPGDVDQDGDLDFVLGNWGLNTKFKASPEHPMSLYVKDFDKNGKSEFVINWKPPADDKTYPFPSKMDLTGQLPSLKKRILKYSEYATMDYESLFTAEEKAQAIERKVVYLESAILRNNNGQYILEALPAAAQVSPIFASAIDDFNKDGKPDIWLGGNFYGLKPEVGRHNDSRSILLLGKEDGGFEAASQLTETIEGEIRTVKRIKEKDGSSRLLIGINDGPVKVLKY